MKCKILHESRGRIRIHVMRRRMTPEQADILEYYLRDLSCVSKVKVYSRTCDATILYAPTERTAVIRALAKFDFNDAAAKELVPDHTGRELNMEYEEKLVMLVARRLISKLMFPFSLRAAIALVKSVGYIKNGVECLLAGKIEVPVLDATAVAVSILRGDYDTASSIMFLLGVGETLEEWTHKKSVDDLARTMSLNVEKVWKKVDGQEELVKVNEIAVGDEIVVRTGNMIPVDGTVSAGEAMVNQSSMTGESVPVHKAEGSYVYAGTVVEEGSCTILVDKSTGSGRYDRIVKMIEESEKLKSSTEDRASHLADKLVPYSLGATALTYLLTGNATKALSILMVDFSCALKLAMPLSVLSAMKEAGAYDISVKGGKFLEAVAQADTIVFDKTGTLTHASPKVAEIVTFGGREENEMLRTAACLEEHYPHSMANAVVAEAKKRGLNHEETHSEVEYIVAHGISSMLDGERVCIGSYHFIFQDEGCELSEADAHKFRTLKPEYSHLYLMIAGKLAAVICIHDPLRDEAAEVVRSLHRLGINKVVMMTGDNELTARSVAEEVGIDEYHAGVLPEDKANFVKAEHEMGRRVIMIGDGVNDSPALSEADAGIAISEGAAIAREIADITISTDDLRALVTLRELSGELMKRIDRNYRFIISFNLGLILLGVSGVIVPTTSALLHNMSTLAISTASMTPLLPPTFSFTEKKK